MRAELIPCKFAVCLYLYITESYSQVFLASSPVQLLPCGFCSLGAKLCTWQQFLLQQVVCFKSWPINWIKLTHKRYTRECVYKGKVFWTRITMAREGEKRKKRHCRGVSSLFFFLLFLQEKQFDSAQRKRKKKKKKPFYSVHHRPNDQRVNRSAPSSKFGFLCNNNNKSTGFDVDAK